MTLEQMEKMTDSDRREFMKKCEVFDESMTLESYTSSIIDYTIIWRRFIEGRGYYTLEYVTESVNRQPVQIKEFYDEKSPVEDAAIDVDYCCG